MSSEYFWIFIEQFVMWAVFLAFLIFLRRNGYLDKRQSDSKAVIYIKDWLDLAASMLKLILVVGIAIFTIVNIGMHFGEPTGAVK